MLTWFENIFQNLSQYFCMISSSWESILSVCVTKFIHKCYYSMERISFKEFENHFQRNIWSLTGKPIMRVLEISIFCCWKFPPRISYCWIKLILAQNRQLNFWVQFPTIPIPTLPNLKWINHYSLGPHYESCVLEISI